MGSRHLQPQPPEDLPLPIMRGQIAAKLFLAEGTVKFYVHAIMQKLGVHNRTQALVIARERNLI